MWTRTLERKALASWLAYARYKKRMGELDAAALQFRCGEGFEL